MTGASSSISVLPGWSHVIISTETLVGKGLKSRLGGGSGISIGAWWLCENTGCYHRQALRAVVQYHHAVTCIIPTCTCTMHAVTR